MDWKESYSLCLSDFCLCALWKFVCKVFLLNRCCHLAISWVIFGCFCSKSRNSLGWLFYSTDFLFSKTFKPILLKFVSVKNAVTRRKTNCTTVTNACNESECIFGIKKTDGKCHRVGRMGRCPNVDQTNDDIFLACPHDSHLIQLD